MQPVSAGSRLPGRLLRSMPANNVGAVNLPVAALRVKPPSSERVCSTCAPPIAAAISEAWDGRDSRNAMTSVAANCRVCRATPVAPSGGSEIRAAPASAPISHTTG